MNALWNIGRDNNILGDVDQLDGKLKLLFVRLIQVCKNPERKTDEQKY